MFATSHRLETARSHWQYGAWPELAALDEAVIAADPERAKLAALVAAAHSHLGDDRAARRLATLALGWGCDRAILARVLVSAVRNSLGRVATALQEPDTARTQFHAAIRLVEPRADVGLLARTREVRETARIGLLPDALAVVDRELAELHAKPHDIGPQLDIFRTEINLLKHEFGLSLQRGQFYRPEPDGSTQPALEKRAVSQLGQDLWVLERTGHKRGGYFVEFGATDGVSLSNTWLLEKEFGWTGLCAEPNPEFLAQLRLNRSCTVSDACIGARSGDRVDFILADVFGVIADFASIDMHGPKREAYRQAGQVIQVTTVSLEDFLLQNGAPREIDYLSIDTEGNEFEILNAFPFDRWTIRLITVEHNFTPEREKIRALLEGHGYVRTPMQHDDCYELTGPGRVRDVPAEDRGV